MLENNNTLGDITVSNEELLGPPYVDIVGLGMMMLVAIVVGFLSSTGVMIFAFLSLGRFSLGSGISPILLAMITFFSLSISNMLYIWSAKGIFPHIYTGSRTTFLHASVFSIILYIAIAPFYLIVNSQFIDGSGILIAYMAHVLLNIFGLEIIVSILSSYRYCLLSIYSSIVSLILTASILFFVYTKTNSESSNALFVLLGLSMLAFFIAIFTTFFIRFCYYRIYITTGSDPIGDVFAQVEIEAKETEKEAEQELFRK
ncbi:hypothetical protein H7169_02310 [Candidatus Gracilibacteria bacterium]|nr:hypothetical protein [Candidatus Gracilibacteria bacterium]